MRQKKKGIAPFPQKWFTTRLTKMNNQLHPLQCFNLTFVLSKSKQNPTKPVCWSPTKFSLTTLESSSKCSASAHLRSCSLTI